ncbi:MAG: hypothetical protein ACW96S_13275 [Promethearchaeota archaeon]|jgi:rubrerythrin
MPVGVVMFRWDSELGPINEGFYPETLKVTNNLLTQIYSSHRFHSPKPGFLRTNLKKYVVLSFFSGIGEDFVSVENHIVALLLRRDEKAGKYREVLKSVAAEMLGRAPNFSAMFCRTCGSLIDSAQFFCPSCGYKIT